MLVIVPLGIYTTAAAGKVATTVLAHEKVDAVRFDGDAVCGRAAPQKHFHESIPFIDVSNMMIESTHWVRSNAYIEATGLELCKSDFHALLHKLDHCLDRETGIK